MRSGPGWRSQSASVWSRLPRKVAAAWKRKEDEKQKHLKLTFQHFLQVSHSAVSCHWPPHGTTYPSSFSFFFSSFFFSSFSSFSSLFLCFFFHCLLGNNTRSRNNNKGRCEVVQDEKGIQPLFFLLRLSSAASLLC